MYRLKGYFQSLVLLFISFFYTIVMKLMETIFDFLQFISWSLPPGFSFKLIVRNHFAITVSTYCNKTVAFCNKECDTFCNNTFLFGFEIKQLPYFI